MSNAPPWKVAVVAGVAIAAGVKLLLTDWSLDELAVFVAMVFIAVGALHIVTMSFVGLPGALSALGGGGELAIGATVLAWPAPTLLVVRLLAGSWIVVSGVAEATILLATRADRRRWLLPFLGALVQVALGVILLIWPGVTARGVGVVLGTEAVLGGTLGISSAVGRQRRERCLRAPAPPRSVAVVS
jgi:uncharacterized membrane protein HdeD (DUF308 family)